VASPELAAILANPELAAAALKVKPYKLQSGEEKAIKDYTGNGCSQMNEDLQNGKRVGKVPGAQNLKAAMASLPNHEGEVYRYIKIDEVNKLENLVVGETFVDKAFLSTSKKDKFANRKFSAEANVEFTIQSRTGKDISEYSKHKDEAEVLFLPGTPFLITEVCQVAGRLCVKMSEITNKMQALLKLQADCLDA
jgi:ADP-ribosyltransferase exoenzyme